MFGSAGTSISVIEGLEEALLRRRTDIAAVIAGGGERLLGEMIQGSGNHETGPGM